jgi:hypothetical protein
MRFDGREVLEEVLRSGGYKSTEAAIAKLTRFVHPDTVAESNNKAIFKVVRCKDMGSRGKVILHHDNSKVVAADNTVPKDVFRWAVGGLTGKDIQYNHVYSKSQDVDVYTSIANICVTPSFLAKLTDHDKKISNLLKYRVFDLYHFLPEGEPRPVKPEIYDQLEWTDPCPVAGKLEDLYRSGMRNAPAAHASISARELGWLFSGFLPDTKLRDQIESNPEVRAKVLPNLNGTNMITRLPKDSPCDYKMSKGLDDQREHSTRVIPRNGGRTEYKLEISWFNRDRNEMESLGGFNFNLEALSQAGKIRVNGNDKYQFTINKQDGSYWLGDIRLPD